MSKATVDIVITTRNNFEILKETLYSIEKQTYKDYLCYVIDDCSDVENIELLKKDFSWVIVLKNTKNCGPSYSRNFAISKGDSPYIAILDDDVVLEPNWLEEMLNFISFSSSIGAVGSQIRFYHSKDFINSIGGGFNDNGIGFDLFFNIPVEKVKNIIYQPRRIVFACSAAMLIRRDVFYKAGRFDPCYFYLAEDFDLCLRINLCGYIVVYNPNAVVFHRYHTTANKLSKSKIEYLYYRNSLLAVLKNFSVKRLKHYLPRIIKLTHIKFSIKAKSFFWILFNFCKILKWRKFIKSHTVIPEEHIFSLNNILLLLQNKICKH